MFEFCGGGSHHLSGVDVRDSLVPPWVLSGYVEADDEDTGTIRAAEAEVLFRAGDPKSATRLLSCILAG